MQYQRIKNRIKISVEKLRLNIVLEKLQQYILVDFITNFLILKGYDSILVVYNKFLKILHFIAIIENNNREISKVVYE